MMHIIKNPHQLTQILLKFKLREKTIGLVPTMGALHAGHLSLIRQARKENDIVVVSIFVNPTQFVPREDFTKYPRPLRHDLVLCRNAGVDFVFHPSAHDMYPSGSRTFVNVEGLSGVLCGASRPGHFRGVATVVAKLFNIVRPDAIYFGQKDAQQAVIMRQMARDLNFPARIKVMPIVRECDGLAMSSRNSYLNPQERADAVVLYESLRCAEELMRRGERSAASVIARIKKSIRVKKSAWIEYAAIVSADTLEPMKVLRGRCLIALAVWIGKTRLIDNIVVNIRQNKIRDAQ